MSHSGVVLPIRLDMKEKEDIDRNIKCLINMSIFGDVRRWILLMKGEKIEGFFDKVDIL